MLNNNDNKKNTCTNKQISFIDMNVEMEMFKLCRGSSKKKKEISLIINLSETRPDQPSV